MGTVRKMTRAGRRPFRSHAAPRRQALIAATAGAMLVVTGCGPGDDAPVPSPPPRSESPSSPPPAPATPATPSATPTPSAGTDLAACADGRCEVRVSGPATIPVPRDLRVEAVRVRSVGSDTVTIVGRYIGNEQSGFCSGGNCSSSGSGNAFTLTLGQGSTGSENDLSITVLTIKDGSAVLRFAPV